MKSIYKILTSSEWTKFNEEKVFTGSENDLLDGFIHLVSFDQIESIIKKYFSKERELIILDLSIEKYEKKLVWEKSSSKILYPHFYHTKIYLKDIVTITKIKNL